jgi:hypothetical protein
MAVILEFCNFGFILKLKWLSEEIFSMKNEIRDKSKTEIPHRRSQQKGIKFLSILFNSVAFC